MNLLKNADAVFQADVIPVLAELPEPQIATHVPVAGNTITIGDHEQPASALQPCRVDYAANGLPLAIARLVLEPEATMPTSMGYSKRHSLDGQPFDAIAVAKTRHGYVTGLHSIENDAWLGVARRTVIGSYVFQTIKTVFESKTKVLTIANPTVPTTFIVHH